MLMFFERLFFRIDTNADGVVMNSTVAIFLSYAAVRAVVISSLHAPSSKLPSGAPAFLTARMIATDCH